MNYTMYITNGQEEISSLDDYTSYNTLRVNVEQVKKLLLKLDFIQEYIQEQTFFSLLIEIKVS